MHVNDYSATVVSLPAQVAAVEALRDPNYYRGRYAKTAACGASCMGSCWDTRATNCGEERDENHRIIEALESVIHKVNHVLNEAIATGRMLL